MSLMCHKHTHESEISLVGMSICLHNLYYLVHTVLKHDSSVNHTGLHLQALSGEECSQ